MSPEKTNKVLTGDALFECEPLPPFIIEKVFGKGDRMLIHGTKGLGKSLTAMSLACSLTSASSWLETFSVHEPQHVLWLLGESTHSRWADRMLKMSKCVPFDKNYMHFYKCQRMRINVDEEFVKLATVLKNECPKIDVIVLDSLYNFVKGDKNKDDVAADWLTNIDILLDMFDCGLIALGHTGKDTILQKEGGGRETVSKGHSAKGAVEWDAAFTIIYEIKTVDKKKGILQIVNHKDRDGECIDKVVYKMIYPQKDKQGRLMAINNECLGSNNGDISCLLREQGIAMAPNEIMESLDNMAESSFYYAVNKCIKEGTVVKYKDDNGRIVYKSLLT